MKKLGLILITIFTTVALSSSTAAASISLDTYPTETLSETFTAEGINYDFSTSNYDDIATDRTTIYVFRKTGCGNCRAFYNFIKSSLLPTYGNKFKVVSFELPIGFEILNQVAEFYGQKPANGVYSTPIVVVGDTISKGFVDATRQQEIIDIINSGTSFDTIDEINAGITSINNSMKTEFTSTSGITLNTTDPYYRSCVLNTTATDSSTISLDGYEYIASHNINLVNGGTNLPLSDTKLTIRIPTANTHKAYKAAYIKDGKIAEVLDAKYADGCVTFETTHLSEYAIYGTDTPTSTPPTEVSTPLAPTEVVETTTTTSTTTTTVKKNVPKAPNTGVRQ